MITHLFKFVKPLFKKNIFTESEGSLKKLQHFLKYDSLLL